MSESSKRSRSASDEGTDPPAEGFPRGWAGHAEAQREAWLRLSHAERLRWLDQAKAFAEAARRARRQA